MSISINMTTEQKQRVTVVTKGTNGVVDTTSAIQVFSSPNPAVSATCVPVNAGASNRDFDVIGTTDTPGTQQFTFFANGKGDQANCTITQAEPPDLSSTVVSAVGSPGPK